MEKVGNRAPYLIAAPAAAFTLLITFLNLPEEFLCRKIGGLQLKNPKKQSYIFSGCDKLKWVHRFLKASVP